MGEEKSRETRWNYWTPLFVGNRFGATVLDSLIVMSNTWSTVVVAFQYGQWWGTPCVCDVCILRITLKSWTHMLPSAWTRLHPGFCKKERKCVPVWCSWTFWNPQKIFPEIPHGHVWDDLWKFWRLFFSLLYTTVLRFIVAFKHVFLFFLFFI